MSSNIKRFGGEILRFKECREKAGLSQREVGDRLGISDSAVCLWEREQGGSLPRASMLPAIAKLYGVTVDKLLSDQGEGWGEVREMDNQQILETLEKQLQLLSERSKKCISDSDLVALSNAMLSISQFLLNPWTIQI